MSHYHPNILPEVQHDEAAQEEIETSCEHTLAERMYRRLRRVVLKCTTHNMANVKHKL